MKKLLAVLSIALLVVGAVTIFSMAEMGARMEQARLVQKHGGLSLPELFDSAMGQTLLVTAAALCLKSGRRLNESRIPDKTAFEPWHWISTVSSPVKECGALKYNSKELSND